MNSAEDMNKAATSLTLEEQWYFLKKHKLFVEIEASLKPCIWSVAIRNTDGSFINGAISGRRDAAVSAAIALVQKELEEFKP